MPAEDDYPCDPHAAVPEQGAVGLEDMDAQMFIEFGGVSSDPSVRREAKKKWKAWKAQFSRK